MATAPEEPDAPLLANVTVVVGFVVVFTTFATDSPWSWIIGGLMVVAGGLWAGLAGTGRSTAPVGAGHAVDAHVGGETDDGTDG